MAHVACGSQMRTTAYHLIEHVGIKFKFFLTISLCSLLDQVLVSF